MKWLTLFTTALSSLLKNRMRSILTMLGIVIGVAAVIVMVAIGQGAQNSIESVNVAPQSGGKVVIRVGLKDALATAPAGFTVSNPPRLAFDFANTGTTLGRNVQNIADGDVRRITCWWILGTFRRTPTPRRWPRRSVFP